MKTKFIKYKIVIIITISLTFSSTLLYSQLQPDNLKKYWFYRNKLKYFVSPGLGQGKSCVSALLCSVLNYKLV